MPKFERLSAQTEDRPGITLTCGSMHATDLQQATSHGRATIDSSVREYSDWTDNEQNCSDCPSMRTCGVQGYCRSCFAGMILICLVRKGQAVDVWAVRSDEHHLLQPLNYSSTSDEKRVTPYKASNFAVAPTEVGRLTVILGMQTSVVRSPIAPHRDQHDTCPWTHSQTLRTSLAQSDNYPLSAFPISKHRLKQPGVNTPTVIPVTERRIRGPFHQRNWCCAT